jgi:hypothetical protein
MNDNEKTRIAAAINQLRPDWPAASLRTLLDRPAITNRPRRDVAVALAWIACETDSKTPARVLESGPWWQAVGVEGGVDGGAITNGVLDPTGSCDTCSQPPHRHGPTSGHEFISVVEAARSRDTSPKPRLPRTKEVPQ